MIKNQKSNFLEAQRRLDEISKTVESLKDKPEQGLSVNRELGIIAGNLVNLEEDFFLKSFQEKEDKYYDLLHKTREIRKELLKKIVKEKEGEVWCISKHLISVSIRLSGLALKYRRQGKKREAGELLNKARNIYLVLEKIHSKSEQELKDSAFISSAEFYQNEDKKKNETIKKLNSLVAKLIDCCKE